MEPTTPASTPCSTRPTRLHLRPYRLLYLSLAVVALLFIAGFGAVLPVALGARQSSTPVASRADGNPPIYISFLWHMHQPIYEPYENVCDTMADDSEVRSWFDQRVGPYTSWPADAIEAGKNAGLDHLGAQVSFSGSLIENLNNIEDRGECYGHFSNWDTRYTEARGWTTSAGNPRLDLVGFGYHHPLMGLIDYEDTRRQIQAHRELVQQTFGSDVAYSKGFFPPENAFSERMIPALVDEGFEWALVDNIHFERACQDYPWNSGGNIYEPNPSDAVNPDPLDWVQLNNVWAPTKVSAQWAHQPHYVQTESEDGETKRMIAVPASRYLGNEDGRGGFGALQYEDVLSQLEPYNTDPDHPILVVLAHDGDNYGGGSEGYYHGNFQNFVQWCQFNPDRFVPTTIQDYLDQFPPASDDVIHVEDGAWAGADNGDPEFLKWNGDPGEDGYSPDRNNWSVITAAKNRVLTAEAVDPHAPQTAEAWRHLMNAETSCYWYWDGMADWDDKPTIAANSATTAADLVLGSDSGSVGDTVGPTIYLSQREPYNPGANEWGQPQPDSVEVWTYVYDLSGLTAVELCYRLDGGSWQRTGMTASTNAARTSVAPDYKADLYEVTLDGLGLDTHGLEYCVEASDAAGNTRRSPHMHVGATSEWWSPSPITFSNLTTGSVEPDVPLFVAVTIGSSEGAVVGAELCYRVNGGPEEVMAMTASGTRWNATIPGTALTQGATITYTVRAEDTHANRARSDTITIHVPHPITLGPITTTTLGPGTPIVVRTTASSSAGTITNCTLHYQLGNGGSGWESMGMATDTDSVNGWQATLPAALAVEGNSITVYCTATDSMGTARESEPRVLVIGGTFYTPTLDGVNDLPASARRFGATANGSTDDDIVGVWCGNDARHLSLAIELGADPRADGTEDFVGVYFSDGSEPSTKTLRYGGVVDDAVGLEAAWWDGNDHYCEHIVTGDDWIWSSNHEAMAYDAETRTLEMQILREEQNHLFWSDGKRIELVVATASEAGAGRSRADFETGATVVVSYFFAAEPATGNTTPAPPPSPPPSERPQVTRRSPIGDAVPVETDISVTFDSAMNATATEHSLVIAPEVAGERSWSDPDRTLTVTPTQPLAYSTIYTVTLGTGARSADGVALGAPFTFTFTTADRDAFPTPTGNLTVGVEGPEGALEGAAIELRSARSGILIEMKRADANGVVHFYQLPYDAYMLRGSASGYSNATVAVTLSARAHWPEVALTLEPQTAPSPIPPPTPGPDVDTDGDGIPDVWELRYGLDPSMADATTDSDGDGYNALAEYRNGTDPSDRLSYPHTSGLDTDGDGLSDTVELIGGTDPFLADTDGDGVDDKREIDAATDPLDAGSYPETSEAKEGNEDLGWLIVLMLILLGAILVMLLLIVRL